MSWEIEPVFAECPPAEILGGVEESSLGGRELDSATRLPEDEP